MTIYHKKTELFGTKKYVCNMSVHPNEEKMKINWKDVTCKNCLRLRDYQ